MKYGRNSRRRQLITFNISLRILVVSNEKAGFKWFRYFHSIVSASDVDIFPTFLPNIYFAIDILFFPLFLWMHVCACLKRLVVDIIHVESTRADYENQIFWIEFIFLPLSLSLSLSLISFYFTGRFLFCKSWCNSSYVWVRCWHVNSIVEWL